VDALAASRSGETPATTCTSQCVIVATMGVGYAFSYAPISFMP
jgi:hypothetical protein